MNREKAEKAIKVIERISNLEDLFRRLNNPQYKIAIYLTDDWEEEEVYNIKTVVSDRIRRGLVEAVEAEKRMLEQELEEL